MTEAIAKRSTQNGLELKEWTSPIMVEMQEMAYIFVKSGMFPDLSSISQAMVKIKAGREIGFAEFTAIAGFHIIKGRVIPGAALQGALVKNSGKYDYDVIALDENHCIIQFYRFRNNQWENMSIPVEYTMEKAQKAGLMSNPTWAKHPEDMLMASALRKGCRRYCPELLAGLGADTEEFDGVVIEEKESPNLPPPAETDEIDEVVVAEFIEAEQIDQALLEQVADAIGAAPQKDRAAFISLIVGEGKGMEDATNEHLTAMLAELAAKAGA